MSQLGMGLGLDRGLGRKWTPLLLGDCLIWIAADHGIVKDGSNNVQTWANRGSGDSFSQINPSSAQPLWVNDDQNGLPGIQFAGGEWMRHGIGPLGTGFSRGDEEFTIIAAFKPMALVNSTYGILSLWLTADPANHRSFAFYLDDYGGSPYTHFQLIGKMNWDGTGSNYNTDSSDYHYTQDPGAMWAFCDFDVTSTEIRGAIASNESGDANINADELFYDADDPCYLGTYYNPNNTSSSGTGFGTLYELLFFDRKLTADELDKVGAYLEAKWDITQPVAAK